MFIFINSPLFILDFAVTTQSKLIFYDSNWTELDSVGQKFKSMSALEYDSIRDSLYFIDINYGNGTILSFKVSDGLENPKFDTILNQLNTSVRATAYDPLSKMLYWTDYWRGSIYRIDTSNLNDTKLAELFIKFDDKRPFGLAINVCER